MNKTNNAAFFIKKFNTCNNVNIIDAYLPLYELDAKTFDGVDAFVKAKEYKFKAYTYTVFIYNNTLYIFKSKQCEYNIVAQSSNIVFKTALKYAYKYVDIHLLLAEWAA